MSSRIWSGPTTTRTIFYIEKDPVTLLSTRVKAHVLGTPASADRLVYEEKDDSFYMACRAPVATNSSASTLQSTVIQRGPLRRPRPGPSAFAVLAPREREFRYDADHLDGRWVIRTNWNAPELPADDAEATRAAWGDRALWTRPGRRPTPQVFIEDFALFHGGDRRSRSAPAG